MERTNRRKRKKKLAYACVEGKSLNLEVARLETTFEGGILGARGYLSPKENWFK